MKRHGATTLALVRALLSDRKWHSTLELDRITWRFGARLYDLREEGWLLQKRPTRNPHVEEWRMVRLLTTEEMAEREAERVRRRGVAQPDATQGALAFGEL